LGLEIGTVVRNERYKLNFTYYSAFGLSPHISNLCLLKEVGGRRVPTLCMGDFWWGKGGNTKVWKAAPTHIKPSLPTMMLLNACDACDCSISLHLLPSLLTKEAAKTKKGLAIPIS